MALKVDLAGERPGLSTADGLAEAETENRNLEVTADEHDPGHEGVGLGEGGIGRFAGPDGYPVAAGQLEVEKRLTKSNRREQRDVMKDRGFRTYKFARAAISTPVTRSLWTGGAAFSPGALGRGVSNVSPIAASIYAVSICSPSLDAKETHRIQPHLVNNALALLPRYLDPPFTSILVLVVLPRGLDTILEEIVVCLGGELGRGNDVVVGAPELLDRVEGDDLAHVLEEA